MKDKDNQRYSALPEFSVLFAADGRPGLTSPGAIHHTAVQSDSSSFVSFSFLFFRLLLLNVDVCPAGAENAGESSAAAEVNSGAGCRCQGAQRSSRRRERSAAAPPQRSVHVKCTQGETTHLFFASVGPKTNRHSRSYPDPFPPSSFCNILGVPFPLDQPAEISGTVRCRRHACPNASNETSTFH